MVHHVIYVPGLGDHMPHGQQLVPGYWRLFGVQGHYEPMHWNDKMPFAPKLERLIARIDELAPDGPVSLVGSSAGASAVLVAYGARLDKVAGVVCICGKINRPDTVNPRYYIENPAFKESLAELQRVLPKLNLEARARILSIRPIADGIVPPADALIPGANNKAIPTFGHGLSIAFALTFGAFSMMRFLKRQVA